MSVWVRINMQFYSFTPTHLAQNLTEEGRSMRQRWAVAAIAVPLFPATAQNLTHGDTKLLLLKRYKDLDYAGSLLQGLKGFAHNRTEHSATICSLHRVTGSR